MKNLLLFEAYATNVYPKAKQVQRHSHYKTKSEELESLPIVNNFIRNFDKKRKSIYREFKGMEIKPVFSNPIFRFIEAYNFSHHHLASTLSEFKDAKPGDILVEYNDVKVLLKRKGLTYSYSEHFMTKHNVSNTKESREVIETFLNLIKGTSFTFRKEEIPALFRD